MNGKVELRQSTSMRMECKWSLQTLLSKSFPIYLIASAAQSKSAKTILLTKTPEQERLIMNSTTLVIVLDQSTHTQRRNGTKELRNTKIIQRGISGKDNSRKHLI